MSTRIATGEVDVLAVPAVCAWTVTLTVADAMGLALMRLALMREPAGTDGRAGMTVGVSHTVAVAFTAVAPMVNREVVGAVSRELPRTVTREVLRTVDNAGIRMAGNRQAVVHSGAVGGLAPLRASSCRHPSCVKSYAHRGNHQHHGKTAPALVACSLLWTLSHVRPG